MIHLPATFSLKTSTLKSVLKYISICTFATCKSPFLERRPTNVRSERWQRMCVCVREREWERERERERKRESESCCCYNWASSRLKKMLDILVIAAIDISRHDGRSPEIRTSDQFFGFVWVVWGQNKVIPKNISTDSSFWRVPARLISEG